MVGSVSMRYPLAASVVVGAALLASVLPLSPAATAETGLRLVGDTVMASAPDFATETFSDPWDYTDLDDIILDGPGPVDRVRNVRIDDDLLRFDADRSGHVSPLWVTFADELPEARTGPVNPIDADRYTHASLHLYASERTPAALTWFGCRQMSDDCLGGRRFTMAKGWHTYTFRLENEFPGLPRPWSGSILGLRLAVSPSQITSFDLDWLRIHRPTGEQATLTYDAPAGTAWTEVGWQRIEDEQRAQAGRGTGVIAPGHTAGTVDFDPSFLPPGTYRFTARHHDRHGTLLEEQATDTPLTIARPPLPVLVAPDRAGGEDYATAVLEDPWDMSGPDDVVEVGNATDVEWRDATLHATNGPPEPNDPYARLRLGPDGIDADRYHRLTVRMSYDGPFGLADATDGGTHGRLIWWRADSGDWDFLDGRPVVTWTDRDTYTVELGQSPELVQESTNNSLLGWSGSRITYLRWDPNEDRGARRWRLHDVWLRADHEARGGFDIVWEDRSSSTRPVDVSLHADSRPAGFGGIEIASKIRQRSGRNSAHWDTTSVSPGTYWIWIEADDGVSVSRRYATGPLQVLDGYQRPAGPADRIDVDDPVLAAIAVSQRRFGRAEADRVFLSRSDLFADSLAGAPLTAHGHLLLVPPRGLTADVTDEIQRVLGDDGEVVVLGGPRAIGADVVDALTAAGHQVRRLAGPSRVETAVAIAEHLRDLAGEPTPTVALARAHGPKTTPSAAWADSVTGGAWATAAGVPLLVTGSETLHPAVADLLARWQVSTTVLLGGQSALSDTVARAVPGPLRIAGSDRAATAARIAADLWEQQAGRLISPGYSDRGWAFGLPAAGLAADERLPLLLADRLTAPPATTDALCGRIVLVGSIHQLSRAVEDSLTAAATPTC